MKINSAIQIVIVVILGFLLFDTVITTTEIPSRYDWASSDNYSEIYKTAKTNKKPLILYFHVSWCGFCKKLNEDYLNSDDVYNYISNFQMVQINPEEGSKQNKIAEKYGVKGYPTFLVTYPFTRKVKKIHPFKKGGNIWSTRKFVDEIKLVIANPYR